MYSLTQEQINTPVESRTSKFLPNIKDIPKEFWTGNIYVKIVEAWYVGDKGPAALYTFNPGFEQDGKKVKNFLMAHLKDFDPMYEHRVAGVALMLSKVFTIVEKSVDKVPE
jgi:hypothetical protein